MPDANTPRDRSGPIPASPRNESRLESWGEIASYLGRDIRTAQRYERDFALPVRRLRTAKQGQVYAYRSEIDEWIKQRQEKGGVAAEPSDFEPNAANPESNAKTNGTNASRQAGTIEAKPSPTPERENGVGEETTGALPWKWAFLALTGLLAVGVIVAALWPSRPEARGKALLFVRPFETLSGEANEKAFVSGLTNELITQLAKADPAKLVVFAPTTSISLGKSSIRELQRELSADYVLEGSVLRAQEQIRINASLVSANDQKTKWANSYTADMREVLKSQDKVVNDVVQQILGFLPGLKAGLRATGFGTVDPAAYEAYLKGRLYFLDRDILRSREAYEAAIEKDPKFAPAQAGLAMTVLLAGQAPNDMLTPLSAVPEAKRLAEQALASDGTLGDAYCVLANIAQYYDYDARNAERLFQKAIEVDPSNVTAHEWYAYYFMVLNRMEEAERERQAALKLDPAALLLSAQGAEIRYYKRDYDGVLDETRKTLRAYPNFVYARIWQASALREKKMYGEAAQEFRLLRQQTNDSPASLSLEGHFLGITGDRQGALKVLGELDSLSQQRFVPALYRAGIYVGLGDRKNALANLQRAYQERYDRLEYLNVDPMADPLRNESEFQELMKRVVPK
jgi:TolB-like protein